MLGVDLKAPIFWTRQMTMPARASRGYADRCAEMTRACVSAPPRCQPQIRLGLRRRLTNDTLSLCLNKPVTPSSLHDPAADHRKRSRWPNRRTFHFGRIIQRLPRRAENRATQLKQAGSAVIWSDSQLPRVIGESRPRSLVATCWPWPSRWFSLQVYDRVIPHQSSRRCGLLTMRRWHRDVDGSIACASPAPV